MFESFFFFFADNNRSTWNAEDVNGGGLGYVASCRLACSCGGFDAPWYCYLTVPIIFVVIRV
jgi:hypothetical protein